MITTPKRWRSIIGILLCIIILSGCNRNKIESILKNTTAYKNSVEALYKEGKEPCIIYISEAGEYAPYYIVSNNYNRSGYTALLRKDILKVVNGFEIAVGSAYSYIEETGENIFIAPKNERYTVDNVLVGTEDWYRSHDYHESYFGSNMDRYLNNEFINSLEIKDIIQDITLKQGWSTVADTEPSCDKYDQFITKAFIPSIADLVARGDSSDWMLDVPEESEQLSLFKDSYGQEYKANYNGENCAWWLRTCDFCGAGEGPFFVSWYEGTPSYWDYGSYVLGTGSSEGGEAVIAGIRPMFCIPSTTKTYEQDGKYYIDIEKDRLQ